MQSATFLFISTINTISVVDLLYGGVQFDGLLDFDCEGLQRGVVVVFGEVLDLVLE